jgi:hypothetical protein
MEIASLENHARKLKNLVRTARIDLELLDETWSNGLYQGLQAEDLDTLERYLKNSLICEDPAVGICSKDLALLESFGVEVAHDINVENLASIPGLTEKQVYDLLNWKAAKKSMFYADLSTKEKNEITSGIDLDYLAKKIPIQAEIIVFRQSLDQCLMVGKSKISEINLKHQEMWNDHQNLIKQWNTINSVYRR